MVKQGHPDFDEVAFRDHVLPQLEPLSLTERAAVVAKALAAQYPSEFPKAAPMVMAAFEEQGYHPGIVKYEEFRYLPFGIFVTEHGIDHFEEATQVLYQLTKRFTSEFPIRPFIERYPEQSMKLLTQWTKDEDQHVRRLVSEGTRPRLPWASRLPDFQKDPEPVFSLLELLKEDDERYVQRSVANNLNDIAKDHPGLVVERLTRWNKLKNPGTQWIIKHASRTLVKAGHTEALLLLGYDPKAKVEVSDLMCSSQVQFGTELKFSLNLQNTGKKAENVVVDFVIHFMKANGKTAPKVFKLTDKRLSAGDSITIERKHPIKPISTRAYYPGVQKLEIQVNGVVKAERNFELLMS